MDEELERLRRAHRAAPEDLGLAEKLAVALDRIGRFDEAWELLEKLAPRTHAGLKELAARRPRAILERLERLDYPRARRFTELLVACGQARHPALVAVATSSGDIALRRMASRAAANALPGDVVDLARITPEKFKGWVNESPRPATPESPNTTFENYRKRWHGLAHKLVEKERTPEAVLLLPWLLPLLTCQDPQLAANALAAVKRLTDRDAPPFDVEALARLLEAGKVSGSEEQPREESG